MTQDPLTHPLLVAYAETPVPVALFDAGDRLQYANAAFRATYGLAPDDAPTWADMLRRNHAERRGVALSTNDIEAWLTSTLSRRGKQAFRAFETDTCDGRWFWMTETLCTGGFMLCIATDITSLRTEARSVRQQRDMALRSAQTDMLTGISNRTHIMQLLQEQIDAPLQGAPTCGIALLDLDHFKHVNDTWGHVAGDEVLQAFVRAVQSLLRREDGFGRVGGEEFLLLLPGVDRAGLEQTVQRIQDRVRALQPLPQAPQLRCTLSAGLALLRRPDSVRDAYHRADQALYEAKAAGRDRAVWEG